MTQKTTEQLTKIGRAFYGIGIMSYGVQQIVIQDFRFVIVPEFPEWAHHQVSLIYLTGLGLILVGLVISGLSTLRSLDKTSVCLYLGFYFLALIILCHVPYRLWISPYKAKHLGVWTDALKELAFSGGAFVMAGSFKKDWSDSNGLGQLLKRLIPFGPVFFSITMISFGFDHFYYTDSVKNLVPEWIGNQRFWTLFAAVALIGSGVAISLKIFLKQIALLLALMLFLWVFLVHIPGAIANPSELHGNNVVSAFDALLFCGISLVIYSKAAGFKPESNDQ